MKKIVNNPAEYTDDMLKGIYGAYPNKVKYVENDLRCYCVCKEKKGKVAIVTGGGTGHLPLFLGYVGEGMLDGCGVGSVFQSPSAEQIVNITKEVDEGLGTLFLYGNYTGDIMNFDMAAEVLEIDDIKTKSIVGSDDILSNDRVESRRGVAGIFFMYKCAGAKASIGGTLDEVYEAANKAKENTATVGFALTPCVIPELGHSNFELGKNEMAFGMGIHGEPGIWNGDIKKSKELAEEAVGAIIKDLKLQAKDEVCLLVNGLGATSLEELYILSNDVREFLDEKNISIYRSFIGEYATSMEMAGASISLCKVDEEIKEWIDFPVNTPFYKQF